MIHKQDTASINGQHANIQPYFFQPNILWKAQVNEENLQLRNDHQFDWFRYSWMNENGDTIIGREFNVPPKVLHHLDLPLRSQFTELNYITARNFIFVTAASSNHFKESKNAIASAQEHFPNFRLLYYDIGLKSDEIQSVSSQCNLMI